MPVYCFASFKVRTLREVDLLFRKGPVTEAESSSHIPPNSLEAENPGRSWQNGLNQSRRPLQLLTKITN